MAKENVVQILTGIQFSNKKDKILPFRTTWMEMEITMLSEKSQLQKDKDCMFTLTCETQKS
jgi:hypothetical protein